MPQVGRPNPHESQIEPQVSARGVVASPNSPAGGTGRGQSRNARPQDADSWWDLGSWWHRAEDTVGSIAHKGEQLYHTTVDEIHRARDIYEAVMLAQSYVPATVRAHLEVDVKELMRAFIPGLLMMFVILAATTLLGATIGAAIGALAGGVGALPGAVVGGDLGLDAGFAVLDAMGIGFLLAGMAADLPKIFEQIGGGINAAWNAGSNPNIPASKDIETAAHAFAEAVAQFMELLVQGLLAYLLRDGIAGRVGKISGKLDKLDATEAVAARSRELIQALKQSPGEVREALKAKIAELENALRKAGRWVDGLVQWLEKHVEDLAENFEKRHPKEAFDTGGGEADGGGGAGGGQGSSGGSPSASGSTSKSSASDKAAQVAKNKRDGVRREQQTGADLQTQHPNASVQQEQYLRNADGTIAKDPLTGEARRIDHVVIDNGQPVDSVETTSMTADKADQVAKEQRIRDNGGTYVRDRDTGNLVNFNDTPTRLIRRP